GEVGGRGAPALGPPGAEPACTASSARRRPVVPARRLPPRSLAKRSRPASTTAARSAADDFSAYGGVVVASITPPSPCPSRPARAASDASTAIVRPASAGLATARSPPR